MYRTKEEIQLAEELEAVQLRVDYLQFVIKNLYKIVLSINEVKINALFEHDYIDLKYVKIINKFKKDFIAELKSSKEELIIAESNLKSLTILNRKYVTYENIMRGL